MASDLSIINLRNAIVGPVDLAVPAGGCAAIGGASGAGKSLFLRMVADLDPNEGEVRLGEARRADMPASAWRRQVVYLAAEAGWWAPTVSAHMPADAIGEAKELAGRLGLSEDYLDRSVASLSTGERQRLALVRALARHPAALLLDEPTSALDPTSTEQVETVLRERLAAGLMLVVASHDAGQAQRLGAARYTMAAGRLSPA